jgi:hypothetical protein
MKKPQPRPQPQPRKVNADSLMNESYRKKEFAKTQAGIAKGQIKRDGGNVSMSLPVKPFGSFTKYGPTGNERMQIVKKTRQSASRDSAIAVKAKPSLTPKKGAKATKPPVNVAKTQKKIDKLMSKPKSKTKVGNAVRTIRTMSLRSKIEK